MRTDRRTAGQLRPVQITTGCLMTAEGSALIKVGNTHVLCAATVEDTVPPFMRNSGKGWVTAEYSMLPRATAKRTPREVTKGRPSGRTHEIQRLIGRPLRVAMALRQLRKYGVLKNDPVREYIAATSVGLVGGVAMLDLCYEEDSQADVDMNVVMTGGGQFVEVQATAEHEPFDEAQMSKLVDLARIGIAELVLKQREIIGD